MSGNNAFEKVIKRQENHLVVITCKFSPQITQVEKGETGEARKQGSSAKKRDAVDSYMLTDQFGSFSGVSWLTSV